MNTSEPPRMLRRTLTWLFWLLLLVGLAGAAVWVFMQSQARKGAKAGGDVPVFVVRRGPLTISVTESGTIQNREKVVIKSEVEGNTTILWLIEEGLRVKKGDKLVELDSSKHDDAKTGQEIVVQNAEAGFIRAREDLAVTKNQAEADISKAMLTKQFADEDLHKYIEGEYPQELKEADSKITIAEEELKRSQDTLKWSTTLAKEKYLSRTELEADRLAAKKAELEIELAKSRRDLLVRFTYKRRLAELKSDVEQANMALERVKRKAAADIVQAEAEYKAKQLQFKREQDKQAKTKEQIAKCTIYAPVAGMVVYATTGRGGWRGNQEPLDEGQQVRERQEIIHLPTATGMKAKIKVHESSLEKVGQGMPVRVTVDALPGKAYAGTVAKIGFLPDAQMAFLNPDLKVYSTQVYIDGDTSDLRPGMTCRAEIVVKELDDVVYVPIQAVLRVDGKPTVHLPGKNGPELRFVKTGLDNNRLVHVVDGLAAGEKVLLAPPLRAAEATSRKHAKAKAPAKKATPASRPSKRERDTRRPSTATPPSRARSKAAPHPTGKTPTTASPAPSAPAPPQAGKLDMTKMRERLSGMSREERRAWFESLTPEQREQMMQHFRSMRGKRGGQRGGAPGTRRRRPGPRDGQQP